MPSTIEGARNCAEVIAPLAEDESKDQDQERESGAPPPPESDLVRPSQTRSDSVRRIGRVSE